MLLTSHFPYFLYNLDYKLNLSRDTDIFFFNTIKFKLSYAKVMTFL